MQIVTFMRKYVNRDDLYVNLNDLGTNLKGFNTKFD